MRSLRIALIVVAGCGRVGFETSGGLVDADPVTTDANDAVVPCTWGPFGPPQRMPAVLLSTSDDWEPTPSMDELELVFYSFRGSSADMYRSTRTSKAAAWSMPAPIPAINTSDAQGNPSLTGDGLDLVFDQQINAVLKIYIAHRTAIDQPFGGAMLLAGIDRNGDEAQPFISLDGLRLAYRASAQLVEATRPDRASAFGPFTSLVAGAGGDNDATLSSDGLELIFSSKSRGGMGGADLFTARRPAIDQPFGPITQILELASARDDVGCRLSADGATLYFNYDADTSGMTVQADLWTATRSCL